MIDPTNPLGASGAAAGQQLALSLRTGVTFEFDSAMGKFIVGGIVCASALSPCLPVRRLGVCALNTSGAPPVTLGPPGSRPERVGFRIAS